MPSWAHFGSGAPTRNTLWCDRVLEIPPLRPKPPSVPHVEAGAVSFAGLLAYAGIKTHGGLTTRETAHVLVIGASGGVGHLAVQIAKRGMGAALVVGVCSSRNAEFVRQCGADEVLAYDRTPLNDILSAHPEWEGRFDLIFDAVGLDTVWTVLAPRLLSKRGRFVAAATPQLPDGRAGEDVSTLQGLATLVRFALRRLGGRYRFINGILDDHNVFGGREYSSLVQWIAEGKVAARLSVTYPLDQLAEAHRVSETGRTVGKISIVIP